MDNVNEFLLLQAVGIYRALLAEVLTQLPAEQQTRLAGKLLERADDLVRQATQLKG